MSKVAVETGGFEERLILNARELAASSYRRQELNIAKGITRAAAAAKAVELLGDIPEIGVFEGGGKSSPLIQAVLKVAREKRDAGDYDGAGVFYDLVRMVSDATVAETPKTEDEIFGLYKDELDRIIEGTRKNIAGVKGEIEAAIRRIEGWPGYEILVTPSPLDKNEVVNEPLEAFQADMTIHGRHGLNPGFTVFTHGPSIYEIDDVLEAGDTDFFGSPVEQHAYFQLVQEIRAPGSTRRAGKDLVLYTARPAKDRDRYEGSKTVPSNIFLTTDPDRAVGIAHDLGGGRERDVWRVVVNEKYLINTLDRGRVKDYQVVGKGDVPVKKMTLWIMGEEATRPGGLKELDLDMEQRHRLEAILRHRRVDGVEEETETSRYWMMVALEVDPQWWAEATTGVEGVVDDPHITVVYMPDVSPAEAEVVEGIVRDVAGRFSGLWVRVMQAGSFPSEGEKIPHVALIELTSSLKAFRRQLVDRLVQVRADIVDQKFPDYTPHVTLRYAGRDEQIPAVPPGAWETAPFTSFKAHRETHFDLGTQGSLEPDVTYGLEEARGRPPKLAGPAVALKPGDSELTKAIVDRLRSEYLQLMGNLSKVGSYDEAEKVKEAIYRWRNYLEAIFLQIRPQIQRRLSDEKRLEMWQRKTNDQWGDHYSKDQDDLWAFERSLSGFPLPSMGEIRQTWGGSGQTAPSKEVLFSRYKVAVPKWEAKSRRASRDAWKWLYEFVEWTERTGLWGGGGRLMVQIPGGEAATWNRDVGGLNFVFRGFDEKSGYQREGMKALSGHVRYYTERAKRVFPWLIRYKLPIEMNTEENPNRNFTAQYLMDRIEGSFWMITADEKTFASILAHEMGHHIYRVVMSSQMRQDWERLIHRSEIDLDLRDVVAMKRPDENERGFSRRIERENPELSIQLDALLVDHRYKHKDLVGIAGIEQYLAKGGDPIVRVPGRPVSGYSAKNPEEAFCEVLGHLVGYGPRTVNQDLLAALKILFPEIQIESDEGLPNGLSEDRKGLLAAMRLKYGGMFDLVGSSSVMFAKAIDSVLSSEADRGIDRDAKMQVARDLMPKLDPTERRMIEFLIRLVSGMIESGDESMAIQEAMAGYTYIDPMIRPNTSTPAIIKMVVAAIEKGEKVTLGEPEWHAGLQRGGRQKGLYFVSAPDVSYPFHFNTPEEASDFLVRSWIRGRPLSMDAGVSVEDTGEVGEVVSEGEAVIDEAASGGEKVVSVAEWRKKGYRKALDYSNRVDVTYQKYEGTRSVRIVDDPREPIISDADAKRIASGALEGLIRTFSVPNYNLAAWIINKHAIVKDVTHKTSWQLGDIISDDLKKATMDVRKDGNDWVFTLKPSLKDIAATAGKKLKDSVGVSEGSQDIPWDLTEEVMTDRYMEVEPKDKVDGFYDRANLFMEIAKRYVDGRIKGSFFIKDDDGRLGETIHPDLMGREIVDAIVGWIGPAGLDQIRDPQGLIGKALGPLVYNDFSRNTALRVAKQTPENQRRVKKFTDALLKIRVVVTPVEGKTGKGFRLVFTPASYAEIVKGALSEGLSQSAMMALAAQRGQQETIDKVVAKIFQDHIGEYTRFLDGATGLKGWTARVSAEDAMVSFDHKASKTSIDVVWEVDVGGQEYVDVSVEMNSQTRSATSKIRRMKVNFSALSPAAVLSGVKKMLEAHTPNDLSRRISEALLGEGPKKFLYPAMAMQRGVDNIIGAIPQDKRGEFLSAIFDMAQDFVATRASSGAVAKSWGVSIKRVAKEFGAEVSDQDAWHFGSVLLHPVWDAEVNDNRSGKDYSQELWRTLRKAQPQDSKGIMNATKKASRFLYPKGESMGQGRADTTADGQPTSFGVCSVCGEKSPTYTMEPDRDGRGFHCKKHDKGGRSRAKGESEEGAAMLGEAKIGKVQSMPAVIFDSSVSPKADEYEIDWDVKVGGAKYDVEFICYRLPWDPMKHREFLKKHGHTFQAMAVTSIDGDEPDKDPDLLKKVLAAIDDDLAADIENDYLEGQEEQRIGI